MIFTNCRRFRALSGLLMVKRMGQRAIRDKGIRWRSFVHVADQRTLTRNGDVPISSSVQDCATRGKLHAVFHMLRISVPSACLGKNLRSKVFHCAKLRDGTRDSVLALKNTRSPFSSFSWFNSFTLAVLRRSRLENGGDCLHGGVNEWCFLKAFALRLPF